MTKCFFNTQIYQEQRLKVTESIADVFVPVPAEHELFTDAATVQIHYSNPPTDITGHIGVKIGWSTRNNEPLTRSSHSITKKGSLSNHTVQQWYDEHTLDPMDPEAQSLVDGIHVYAQHSDQELAIGTRHYFRLNEDLTAFCTAKQLDTDKRLNMLISRYNGELLHRDQKYVPCSEREIEQHQGAGDKHFIENIDWLDPIDVQRHQGRKYLKQMYRYITNHCEVMNQSYESRDLLIGDIAPTFR